MMTSALTTRRRARSPAFSSDLTLRSLLSDRTEDPPTDESSGSMQECIPKSHDFDDSSGALAPKMSPRAKSFTPQQMQSDSQKSLAPSGRQRSFSAQQYSFASHNQKTVSSKQKSVSSRQKSVPSSKQKGISMRYRSLNGHGREKSLTHRQKSFTPSFLGSIAERVRSASPQPKMYSSNPDHIIASLNQNHSPHSSRQRSLPRRVSVTPASSEVGTVSMGTASIGSKSRNTSNLPRDVQQHEFDFPRHHSSTSLRRVLSMGRSRRDSDVQSVVSEPIVYADSAHIADDIWIAPKDLYQIERQIAQNHDANDEPVLRPKRKPPVPPLESAHQESVLPKEPSPEKVREKSDPFTFRTASDMQDISSRLINLFFSTGSQNPVPPSSLRAAELNRKGMSGSSRLNFRSQRGKQRAKWNHHTNSNSFRAGPGATMPNSQSGKSIGRDGRPTNEGNFETKRKLRGFARIGYIRRWIRRVGHRNSQRFGTSDRSRAEHQ